MLRPERMSKVSVTGSKAVMPEVIETVHGLNLVHLSDYDGSWEGFDNGVPIEGSEEASEKLVTVRSLESILGVDEDDAGPTRTLDEDELDSRLAEIRKEVNELDERREELREELREVEEDIDAMKPFARLGIDLDLLTGYDAIDVAVGEGREGELEAALADAEEVDGFETFSGDGVVAIAAVPAEGADDPISDALVGVEFTRHEVPEADGSPGEYIDELRHEKRRLERKIESIESDLEEIKVDVASFLLAAEERLSVEVERTEAPLHFATTQRSFIAEGWIPTERYDELVAALENAVDDRLEIEELERADYDGYSDDHGHEETEDAEVDEEPSPGAGREEQAVADGGVVTVRDDPPVIQNNPTIAKPFETLVQAVARPKYGEFDPTILLLLTYPLFFGFMISDVGYGVLYVLIGYFMWQNFESEGITSLGAIVIWWGGFTIFFGVLFGEFFGLHELGYFVFEPILGEGVGGLPLLAGEPIAKGLSPATTEFALVWLFISVCMGILHLLTAWTLDFFKQAQHDVSHAMTHSASWILMLLGAWIWVLSTSEIGEFGLIGADLSAAGEKPATLVGPESYVAAHLGFPGFSETVGVVGLVLLAVGLVLLAKGALYELVEALQVFVHVLSYARITAVLLAKGGMAFVVNLLVFGAYETAEGSRPYIIGGAEVPTGAEVMFEGLFHMGPAAFILGIFVLVFGHLLVLALGVTSAGLQGIRLEYVEFFGKFYEGGGKKYEPFGYQRRYTED